MSLALNCPMFANATEEELRFIATLDYGQDKERHLEALRSLCSMQHGILGPNQEWFPYEVVELGSHHLQAGREREFFICTMLVLANVKAGTDTATDVQEKKKSRAAEYELLPRELRGQVLDAYAAIES
ncbi:hypothetical protein BWI17_00710 [Betaproteobacteria bacterium GR16-43]|nr:hypothetical protein BWI17_00710 [Betaproteobacteria bacterium GR16-43]